MEPNIESLSEGAEGDILSSPHSQHPSVGEAAWVERMGRRH